MFCFVFMSSMLLIMWLFLCNPCHLCVCVTFVLALHVLRVRLLSSGHHVCPSVTKRHKAHLKRLDRRWTLGGVISRQQSRGDFRQTLHHLPLFLCYCPTYCLFVPRAISSLSSCTHWFSLSLCVVFQANAFIVSRDPPLTNH